jgi:hypothetical protein
MSSKKIFHVAGLMIVMISARSASADRHSFANTYEYATLPEGDVELEFYNTQQSTTFDTASPTSFEWKVEAEYGITDHWSISLYQVFSGSEGGSAAEPLHYDATSVETRYRLAQRGEWPVDVMLYGELEKPFGLAGVTSEAKLILARDFGKVTVAANLILEVEASEKVSGVDTTVEYEAEPEYAVGATYELDPRWKIGAESWGQLEAFEGEAGYQAWAGPALSWAPSPKVWITSTAGFGLTKNGDDFNFRLLLGLSL